MERNIRRMASFVRPPILLRPHAKTHKSPNVAALQIEAGAVGTTTATVWEAAALAHAGIENILIANEVVGATRLGVLAAAGAHARITVAVDSIENARELSSVLSTVGTEVGALVDVDIGMGRCGVRSPAAAVELAGALSELPGIRFDGVMGFEGHCSLEPDRKKRTRLAREAVARLVGTADAIRATGIPVETVSAGGTGTFDLTGTDPRVTELQAGSYAFMDTAHAAVVSGFEFALTVLATVVSRHGSTVVLDAGKKTLGLETPLPLLPTLESSIKYVAEEHTVLDVGSQGPPDVGERLEIVPSYCPVTVNLHEAYLVVEHGVVVDVWPILARGAGWPGAE
jgi:D-serine deaminase-like pyridoxal phosphate-dependent protein